MQEVQPEPDREKDRTATWSLILLRDTLRKGDLPHIAKETVRVVLHDAGDRYQRTLNWWQTEGKLATQPHEYEQGGTAKLLTLFRPATGELRVKGVPSAINAMSVSQINSLSSRLTSSSSIHQQACRPKRRVRSVPVGKPDSGLTRALMAFLLYRYC